MEIFYFIALERQTPCLPPAAPHALCKLHRDHQLNGPSGRGLLDQTRDHDWGPSGQLLTRSMASTAYSLTHLWLQWKSTKERDRLTLPSRLPAAEAVRSGGRERRGGVAGVRKRSASMHCSKATRTEEEKRPKIVQQKTINKGTIN